MKFAIVLLVLLSSFESFSQNQFKRVLKEIIADTSNNFAKYRAGFKDMWNTDSCYYSSVTLEGTTENDISCSGSECRLPLYSAKVSDSTNKKRAAEIVDEWKDKLSSALGSVFKVRKKSDIIIPEKDNGYKFERGNLAIFIDYNRFLDTKYYSVALTIIYENQSPR